VEFFERLGLTKRNEKSPPITLILDDQDENVLSDRRNLKIFTQYLHHLKVCYFLINVLCNNVSGQIHIVFRSLHFSSLRV